MILINACILQKAQPNYYTGWLNSSTMLKLTIELHPVQAIVLNKAAFQDLQREFHEFLGLAPPTSQHKKS